MLERVRKHFLTDLDHYRLYLASLPPDAYVESCRWKTWIVLEYPYSSLVAKVCVLWAVSDLLKQYVMSNIKKKISCVVQKSKVSSLFYWQLKDLTNNQIFTAMV